MGFLFYEVKFSSEINKKKNKKRKIYIISVGSVICGRSTESSNK